MNRRLFLRGIGITLSATVVSLIRYKLPTQNAEKQAFQVREDTNQSIERWLLETGITTIDDPLYAAILTDMRMS